MKQLLATTDQSYALSVRIALDAAQIPYLSSPIDGASVGYGDLVSRVTLLNDEDFERASRAIAELQRTTVTVDSESLFTHLARATFYFLIARGVWLLIASFVHQAWTAVMG